MREERGSALITVILVVLVLTLVGLAALVYMGMEDRISANDRLSKEALYAAEVGLRQGERALATQLTGGNSITMLLSRPNDSVATPAVTPAVPQVPAAQTMAAYDLAHLGTYLYDASGTAPLANQAISYDTPSGTTVDNRAYYSLYLRNNPDDYTGTPTQDQDAKVVLISVGYIQGGGGNIVAVKIVAEGFNLGSQFALGGQADWNAGGTNAQ